MARLVAVRYKFIGDLQYLKDNGFTIQDNGEREYALKNTMDETDDGYVILYIQLSEVTKETSKHFWFYKKNMISFCSTAHDEKLEIGRYIEHMIKDGKAVSVEEYAND